MDLLQQGNSSLLDSGPCRPEKWPQGLGLHRGASESGACVDLFEDLDLMLFVNAEQMRLGSQVRFRHGLVH